MPAIQQILCCDQKRVRDIMCMTRAKCLWLLQFDFARLRKTQQIPPKVCGGEDISLFFQSLCWMSKQKLGWNDFLYCCHTTSWCQFAYSTSTATRGNYSTWLQGTSIMQNRFEHSLKTYLTVTAISPVAFPPAACQDGMYWFSLIVSIYCGWVFCYQPNSASCSCTTWMYTFSDTTHFDESTLISKLLSTAKWIVEG